MTSADFWWYFWIFGFITAGTSFALIAVVVMVRGVADLKSMIRILEERHRR